MSDITPSPATEHTTTDLAALSAAIQNWQEAAVRMGASLAASFLPIGLAAQQAVANLAPLALLLLEAPRGPTIGQKRRRRRARGRRRGAGL